MHEFYKRMQSVFTQAGSNRNQFCRKRGYNYQTLQAYWNTDKLPPGAVLEDIAREYSVSLDTLVLGRTALPAEAAEGDPAMGRIAALLKQMDGPALAQVEGALKMFRYLALTDRLVPGTGGPPPAGAAVVVPLGQPVSELIPDKTEKALALLSELSLRVRQSAMGTEDKAFCRATIGAIVQNLYEREVKDEWAELEELPQ